MIAAVSEIPTPQRVLIIKPSALGDIVTAMPVLRGLKRTFPGARISWLISNSCMPLIQCDSDLDETIAFERPLLGKAWRSLRSAAKLKGLLRTLRGGNFDLVLDLQGLLRSGLLTRATHSAVKAGFADAREASSIFYTHKFQPTKQHTVDRNIGLARSLGIDAQPEDMTLQITERGSAFSKEFCRENNVQTGEFIACVPPTRWKTKLYPRRHWKKVVNDLSNLCKIAILGSPEDAQLCESIAQGSAPGVVNLAGQTDVQQMAGIIAASGGVICCDSAAKFIAPAVGVDCVTLIGPTRVELTGPYRKGKAIIADVPCQGCLKRRCRHISCMEFIDPSEVISAAKKMFETRVS